MGGVSATRSPVIPLLLLHISFLFISPTQAQRCTPRLPHPGPRWSRWFSVTTASETIDYIFSVDNTLWENAEENCSSVLLTKIAKIKSPEELARARTEIPSGWYWFDYGALTAFTPTRYFHYDGKATQLYGEGVGRRNCLTYISRKSIDRHTDIYCMPESWGRVLCERRCPRWFRRGLMKPPQRLTGGKPDGMVGYHRRPKVRRPNFYTSEGTGERTRSDRISRYQYPHKH